MDAQTGELDDFLESLRSSSWSAKDRAAIEWAACDEFDLHKDADDFEAYELLDALVGCYLTSEESKRLCDIADAHSGGMAEPVGDALAALRAGDHAEADLILSRAFPEADIAAQASRPLAAYLFDLRGRP